MEKQINIGIGIITKNRREVFLNTYNNIKKFQPENSKLVVVDDGSTEPLLWADIIHNESKGIAQATNVALSLLEDCDHIFIFNDDTYPVVNDWWVPYVQHKEKHLNLSFERDVFGKQQALSVYVKERLPDTWIYANPNGCMMYLTNEVLQTVGGLDPNYKLYGLEHSSYSRRIYNAGLTTYPYMDIPDAIKMFYSHDYYKTTESSVSQEDRRQAIKHNIKLFKADKHSKAFINYKQ